LPFSTQEIYPAAHEGRLYLAGGIAARLGMPYFTNRCVSYDPKTDSWDDEPALPEDLHHVALVSTGTDLFAIGGFNGGYTRVWRMRERVYRLMEEGWQDVTALPKPLAEGVATFGPTGLIHLVTGQSPRGEANTERSDHREVHDHLCFDPKDGRWRELAPIPTARNSATGGWLHGRLVVTGGRTASGNLAVTEVYDPASDAWHSAAPLPLPQAGTAGAVARGRLHVFGGEIFSPTASVFAEAWEYALDQDRWLALPELPTPRHGLGAATLGEDIHVVGGATEPGGRGTSDCHEVLRA
jgi:N-acetylneuraminic acid mutarotase